MKTKTIAASKNGIFQQFTARLVQVTGGADYLHRTKGETG